MIVRVNMRQLMYVAEWTERNRRHVMSTIRELADSEENYLIIARELERVKANNIRARSLRAEASLTLIEWLSIVDAYQWKCAYCKEKPFKVMHHIVPFPEGGTSRSNCLPSCRSCHNRSQKKASAQPPQIIEYESLITLVERSGEGFIRQTCNVSIQKVTTNTDKTVAESSNPLTSPSAEQG